MRLMANILTLLLLGPAVGMAAESTNDTLEAWPDRTIFKRLDPINDLGSGPTGTRRGGGQTGRGNRGYATPGYAVTQPNNSVGTQRVFVPRGSRDNREASKPAISNSRQVSGAPLSQRGGSALRSDVSRNVRSASRSDIAIKTGFEEEEEDFGGLSPRRVLSGGKGKSDMGRFTSK